MKLKRRHAFTLAEVLVTLTIIGVIAALTIPTLNQNTQNNELVSGCLKAYSSLSQAIDKMKIDYGPIGLGKKWNSAEIFWKGTNGDHRDGFTAQFNTVRIDDNYESKCYDKPIKELSNTVTDHSGFTMVTTDGMCFNYSTGFCSDKGVADGVPTAQDKNLTNCMGRFLVDVNGEKGPNVYGRDIYFFLLVKGKGIIPAGNDNNSANCTKGSNGMDCAARVIKEKKINHKPVASSGS